MHSDRLKEEALAQKKGRMIEGAVRVLLANLVNIIDFHIETWGSTLSRVSDIQ